MTISELIVALLGSVDPADRAAAPFNYLQLTLYALISATVHTNPDESDALVTILRHMETRYSLKDLATQSNHLLTEEMSLSQTSETTVPLLPPLPPLAASPPHSSAA